MIVVGRRRLDVFDDIFNVVQRSWERVLRRESILDIKDRKWGLFADAAAVKIITAVKGQYEARAMEVEEHWTRVLRIGRAVYMRLDGSASIARGDLKDKVWVGLRALCCEAMHKSKEEDDDPQAQLHEEPHHTCEFVFSLV